MTKTKKDLKEYLNKLKENSKKEEGNMRIAVLLSRGDLDRYESIKNDLNNA